MSLRVLYVIDSLGYGGAEQSLVELLPQYAQLDVDATIACLVDRETSLVERASGAGAEVVNVPPGNILSQALSVNALARARASQVLHTTLFRADLVGRLASIGLRIPVLTSLVNTQYGPERATESSIPVWKLWLARQLDRWMGRFLTDHFHANSFAVRDASLRHLHVQFSDITVIPRGRDPERYSPTARVEKDRIRQELGLDSSHLVVLNVGRQEPQKGQKYLLRAFARVIEDVPSARLILVGRSGASSPDLKEDLRRLDLGGSVILLSHRHDIPDILGAADVFVLSSLWEGLPNVVIEAMAVGLPVVASDIPPVREIVENRGSAMLAPCADPVAMADLLQEILGDASLRERLGQRGHELFLERFTVGPVASEMVELYRSLAVGTSG